jgi:hypothetical protein
MSPDQRTAEGTTDRSTEVRDDDVASPRQRFELSIPQLLAGALAAASAAVAASWLGVAGTVTGAVLASVVVSVSSALYKHSLERSSQVIRETLPVLPVVTERYRNAQNAPRTETIVDGPRRRRHRTGASPARARRIKWGAVAVSCLLTLVTGFALLTAVEAVLGKSAETLTGSHGKDGGTTLSRILGHHGSHSGDNTKPSTPGQASTTGDSTTAPTSGTTTTTPSSTAPSTSPTTTAPPSTTSPTTTSPPQSTAPATQTAPTATP